MRLGFPQDVDCLPHLNLYTPESTIMEDEIGVLLTSWHRDHLACVRPCPSLISMEEDIFKYSDDLLVCPKNWCSPKVWGCTQRLLGIPSEKEKLKVLDEYIQYD
jgi:hypothetical protein